MIPIYEADRLEDLPLFDRGPQAEADVGAAVDAVLEAVRIRGDEALREYTRRFDGADLSSFEVTEAELEAAWEAVDEDFRETLRQAAANIRRFHEAKEQNLPYVTCWGDGSPLREFLYVDDLANLCVFLMNHYSGNETVNAGTGKELTIKALTELVAKVVGYTGEIRWDPSKPNGTPRKLLDVSKATALGWTYRTELEDGIRLSYEDFLHNPMRAER